MKNKVYSRYHVADPSGKELPWIYVKQINAQFDFTPLVVFFCTEKDGKFDFDNLDAWLNSTDCIPLGSTVMINAEGPVYAVTEPEYIDQPRQEGIDLRMKILKRCKSVRNDCSFGFFSNVPCDGWWAFVDQQYIDAIKANFELCHDLVNEADFIMPCVYFEDTLTAEKQMHCHREWMRLFRGMFPHKKVIPIVWAQWYSVWRKLHAELGPDENAWTWTPEIITRSDVPYDYMAAVLDGFSAGGIDEVALWEEGRQPYRDDRPGLRAIVEWTK